MVESQAAIADQTPSLHTIGLDAGPDGLVDEAAEANERVVSEEPHLPVRRETGPRVQEHAKTDVSWIGELASEQLRRRRLDMLVRIDVEDEGAAGEIERMVAGGREIAPPWKLMDARPVRTGDSRVRSVSPCPQSPRPPARGGPRQRRELLFVLDDQAGREALGPDTA
jgi:hypothetical protein